MAGSPETPFNNTPELWAIRQAEQDILAATNPGKQDAIGLGRNLVKASYDYFVWFSQKHGSPFLDESIMRYERILDGIDSGNTEELRLFLKNRVRDMFQDPTWFVGQSDDMLEFPEKLKGIADAIGN